MSFTHLKTLLVCVDLSTGKYIMETRDISYLAHKSLDKQYLETHIVTVQHVNYWKI